MDRTSNKLFHVLVVVGSSMTGALVGCSAGVSGVNADAAADAAADGKESDAPYGRISPAPLPDGSYPTIGYLGDGGKGPCNPSCPPDLDAGQDAADASDAYPGIRPAGDF